MRKRFWITMAALVALSSCAPRPAPPPPVPQPAPRPQAPAPLPPPPPAQWEDALLTAGDWTYRGEGPSSVASFASLFSLRCEPGRRIALSLAGGTGAALTIRTSHGARSLAAQPGPGALVALLPATDGLLDQIAFSRGRFAVEAPGAGRLILPAWPEIARVIEDCRG